MTSQHGDRRWRSCSEGIIDNIKLGLSNYFSFSETKNQNTPISLVTNNNRCHKWKENNILS